MQGNLDIVVYAADADDTDTSSQRAAAIFDLAAEEQLHLALIELPASLVNRYAPGIAMTGETVTCLRSVLMKPEQVDWVDPIMEILERCAKRASST